MEPRQGGGTDQRWQVFIAFWFLGAVALVAIGIAMFATVAHAHRVGGIIVLLGIICLTIGLVVRRAGQRAD
jgi:hypothetical protein